jgi:hypothetical protein
VSFPATLGRRQRLLAGLVGVGLGFGAPFALSVAMMATSGDPAFIIFPLPFLGALWLMQGLAPAAYRLDERGVVIERRLLPRIVPYGAIRNADRTPRPIGGLLAIGVNGLFGSRGPRWNARTGLHWLAITNTTDLVYLHTSRGLMVISPERPDEFVLELTRRLGAAAPGAAPPSRRRETPPAPADGHAIRAKPGRASRADGQPRGPQARPSRAEDQARVRRREPGDAKTGREEPS